MIYFKLSTKNKQNWEAKMNDVVRSGSILQGHDLCPDGTCESTHRGSCASHPWLLMGILRLGCLYSPTPRQWTHSNQQPSWFLQENYTLPSPKCFLPLLCAQLRINTALAWEPGPKYSISQMGGFEPSHSLAEPCFLSPPPTPAPTQKTA